MNKCYRCNKEEPNIPEDYGRCSLCQAEHNELAKRLDAKPKGKDTYARDDLLEFKMMQGGIMTTMCMTRSEAILMGKIRE